MHQAPAACTFRATDCSNTTTELNNSPSNRDSGTIAAHRAAAAAFGGNNFADIFSTNGTALDDVAYVIDHSSLGLLMPAECLSNGQISTPKQEERRESVTDAVRTKLESSKVLCRRLRPEIFSDFDPTHGNKASTSRAMMAKLQSSVPDGNLSLIGSAKVLEKISSAVRMLGSLQPKSQRFPADVQATCHDLPYARGYFTMSHVTPATVAKTFHAAGIGMRHLGYAAHLASFNNRYVY